MAGQNESSTQLNTGSGGDLVRDLSITPPETGVAVKQQVVSIGDPTAADNLAAVAIGGVLYVRADDLVSTERAILRELRRIRWILSAMADHSSDDDDVETEEEN